MEKKTNRKKYATLNDVAKLANTSIATVSYILNGSNKRYVSAELRERVLEAIKELNYMKSAVASSLKGKDRGILAVLVPQFDNPFFTKIIVAIEEVVHRYGYIISISTTVDDIDKEKEIIDKMIGQRVDGFIISPTIQGTENTDHLRRLGIPYVITERPLSGIDQYDFVGCDNWGCGYSATKHLIENGHKKIGFIGWNTLTNVGERENGYYAAMKEYGLQVNKDWIQLGSLDTTSGSQMMQRILQTDVSALVLGSHILAEGGIQLLREEKISIPNDISLVIIGTPNWTRLSVPTFTCVHQFEHKIGTMAAEILMKNILNTEEDLSWHHENLTCEIIIGESVKKIK